MTKAFIGSLVLEVLGIYAIIQAIQRVGGVIQTFAFTEGLYAQKYLFFGSLIPFLLLLGTGFVLFVFSRKVADEPEPSTARGEVLNSISFQDFHAMAFSLVGVTVLILALHEAVLIGGNLYSLQLITDDWQKRKLQIETIVEGVRVGLLVVLGIWLFLGARKLTDIWQRLRQRWEEEKNPTSG